MGRNGYAWPISVGEGASGVSVPQGRTVWGNPVCAVSRSPLPAAFLPIRVFLRNVPYQDGQPQLSPLSHHSRVIMLLRQPRPFLTLQLVDLWVGPALCPHPTHMGSTTCSLYAGPGGGPTGHAKGLILEGKPGWVG